MKLIYIECDADELKSTRTLSDILVDALSNIGEGMARSVNTNGDGSEEDESE